MQGFDFKDRKLFIGLPAYDFKLSVKLALALAQVAQAAPAYGLDIQIGTICGCSVISRARNLIVQDFLESDCTDLLMVDADMAIDPQDVFRLLAWSGNPRRSIVAGVGCTKQTEKVYVATLDYDENRELTLDGNGLVRVESVGTGFMMIRREVVEKLISAHPEWKYYDQRSKRDLHSVFDFESRPTGYVGEDYLFCERARAHGFSVWVDPSIKLGHMGMHEYQGDFGADVLYPQIVSLSKVA